MKTLSAWLLITILPLILVSQVIAGGWDKIKIATEGDYPPWNFVPFESFVTAGLFQKYHYARHRSLDVFHTP